MTTLIDLSREYYPRAQTSDMVDGGWAETHSLVCNVLGLLGWVAGTETSLSALRKQLVDGKLQHMAGCLGMRLRENLGRAQWRPGKT